MLKHTSFALLAALTGIAFGMWQHNSMAGGFMFTAFLTLEVLINNAN